jgi:hypothetical protein
MQHSSARQFHAVLIRDHKARRIGQDLHSAHPHLSHDDLGAMNRKELDAWGCSINDILGMSEDNPLKQYHDRASIVGWGLEPAAADWIFRHLAAARRWPIVALCQFQYRGFKNRKTF